MIRFNTKWVMSPKTGCWLWTASCFRDGYAQFKFQGRNRLAHVLAYELHRGPVPEGLELDHTCRVRHCVNPWHLEPVTHQENVLRGNGLAAQNARKTECPAGHLYDEANTLVCGRRRFCRACAATKADRKRRAAGVPVRSIGPRSKKFAEIGV